MLERHSVSRRPIRFVNQAFIIAIIWFTTVSLQAQISPKDQLARMQANDALQVLIYASEPMITNPAAIDIDTQGRVWVAEIQWYRQQAKQPPADKIKVLEDTDGDGQADKVTVFAEGLFCPMSICVAGDKVYVATSPDLWVYEDKNGDLKADGPPQKLLTGWGGVNHDHGAHSLVLGPDHQWWMSTGDAGFDLTGTDGSHIAYQWGAILRGELDGSKLETVAVNFRNPYEVCVNSFGEAFCSDNDNDGNQSVRICWILAGGNYGWYGRPPERAPPGMPLGEHWHFRGHVPGHVPATLVTGFGSPCGICCYESDVLGPDFKNAQIHTDAGPAEVRRYRHENSGFGMQATQEVFLSSQDRYFRPDDVCVAPDGSLYVSDWYDGGVGGHAYNNPHEGRIFLLRPKNATLKRLEKPGPYQNIPEAIAGLKSPNLATQYLARERLLAEGEASIPALIHLLSDSEPNFRARALWVLDRMGGRGREAVIGQLTNEDPAFRALAVRILRRHGSEYAHRILPLAGDKSDEVVREVLLAIRSLKFTEADAALAAITGRYDGHDRYLLEAINIAMTDRKDNLYKQLTANGELKPEQIDLLQLLNPQAANEFLKARLFSQDPGGTPSLIYSASTTDSFDTGKILLRFLAEESAACSLRMLALDCFSANLNGVWRNLKEDEQLSIVFQKLLTDELLQRPALHVIRRHRLSQLAPSVLALASSAMANTETRCAAIETLVQFNDPQFNDEFHELLKSDVIPIREAAFSALIDQQDWTTVEQAFTDQAKITPKMRAAVVDRLLASTGGALLLLKLIKKDQLHHELKEQVIEKAAAHPDANVRAVYEEFIPPAMKLKKLGELVSAQQILALKGDKVRGESIFMQSSAAQCKNCHSVLNIGGKIGPELDLIGKKYERETLLKTILNPSEAIAPEYIPYIATLVDGRLLVGFITEKSDDEMVLKDANGRLTKILRSDVESLVPQSKSMMPELTLSAVSAQDAADLREYLVNLKEAK